MVNSIEIEYLEPKNEFRVGSVKNIAVPSNNKDDIKKMFPGSKKNESNADMLSQSFGAIPEISPIPQMSDVQTTSIGDPVQISPIPVVQNSNLESEPVNLDMNSLSIPKLQPQELAVNNIPELTPVEQTANVSSIEPIMESASLEQANNIVNEVSQDSAPVFDSGFKVSDAPNIFDNPIPVTPLEENKNLVDSTNVFSQPEQEEDKEEKVSINKSDINDDIISAEIAILENDIKHYEGLAENSRKKIELLKKQIKKDKNDVNLENTASNLFNNNGVLDDEKVLGKTPMPNLISA